MADINITPLVDVMLVLLIIFMVAAPVMEKERSKRELEENRDKQQRLVALNLPALDKAGAATQLEFKTLKLRVSDQLVVTVEDKIVADCSAHRDTRDKRLWEPCLDQVESAILAQEGVSEGGVAVDADDRASFGFIVGIMHRLHRAKIDKVSMFPQTTGTPPKA